MKILIAVLIVMASTNAALSACEYTQMQSHMIWNWRAGEGDYQSCWGTEHVLTTKCEKIDVSREDRVKNLTALVKKKSRIGIGWFYSGAQKYMKDSTAEQDAANCNSGDMWEAAIHAISCYDPRGGGAPPIEYGQKATWPEAAEAGFPLCEQPRVIPRD